MNILKYLATFLGVFSGVFATSRTDLSRWGDIEFTAYQTSRKDKANLRQDFANLSRDIRIATEVAKEKVRWQRKENSVK